MSKPPPSGQIAKMPYTTESCRLCNGEPMAPWPPGTGKGPTHHTCHPGEERAELERAAHDASVAANVAAALAQAWRDELARPPRAPRRPGDGEVPAARFGPADRRTGSERR